MADGERFRRKRRVERHRRETRRSGRAVAHLLLSNQLVRNPGLSVRRHEKRAVCLGLRRPRELYLPLMAAAVAREGQPVQPRICSDFRGGTSRTALAVRIGGLVSANGLRVTVQFSAPTACMVVTAIHDYTGLTGGRRDPIATTRNTPVISSAWRKQRCRGQSTTAHRSP